MDVVDAAVTNYKFAFTRYLLAQTFRGILAATSLAALDGAALVRVAYSIRSTDLRS